MREFPKITMSEATSIVNDIDNLSDDEFQILVQKWKNYRSENAYQFDPVYNEIRKEIVSEFSEKFGIIDNSELDICIGLILYTRLEAIGFSVVNASDDDVWRYLSLIVFPDLTYFRFPTPEKGALRINRKRFYSHTRRIWLKTLWWYIYLSWQGDSLSTQLVLAGNGSNIISHFIERVGKGYRLELYRTFMAEFSRRKKSDSLFRAASKMNLARCMTVEPELSSGGTYGYSVELFNEVSEKGS